MIGKIALTIVALSWLSPVAAGNGDRLEDEVTIGSLERRAVSIPLVDIPVGDNRAAIKEYKEYLALPETDPALQLEALRRLGDLSLEVGEVEDSENPAYHESIIYHADAIRIYEQLLERKDGYEKADKVMYQLSRAYEGAGDQDCALTTLDRLVSEYPDSPYLDEAEFRRGEIFFIGKNYRAAGEAFAQVVKIGDVSPFYQQALYKSGWSLFKQAEYDQSISTFLDLLNLRLAAVRIDETAEADEPALLAAMTRPDRELVDDTLRILSLTFSYLEGPASINAYLDQRKAGDSSYLLYTSLGALYREKDRYLDAANTYLAYVEREPFAYYSPALSTLAIDAYRDGRFPSLVLEAKQTYVENYGLHSDYWAFHEVSNRQDVIDPLKSNLSDLALHDHAEAQKTGAPEAYASAAGWYRRFLEYFTNDPDSAQRSFLLGEILMESRDFVAATEFYELAAYFYPGYPQAAEAGYAGLLASRAQLAISSGPAKQRWEMQQLGRSVRFATVFPQHPQSAAVLTDAAESYFAAGQMESAIWLAEQVLERDLADTPQLRKVAWTVIAHGNFDLGDYAPAELAYSELRSLGGSLALAGVALDERIAAAVYRQAEAAQVSGDTDAAVMNYLRVATAAPGAATGGNAVYDAAALLMAEQRWDRAIEVLTRFRTNYPQHKFSDDVTTKLALAYQQSGQSIKAAQEFEQVAALASADAAVRREALWTAANLYEETVDLVAARRVWETFLKQYPDPFDEALEVQQKLADLASEMHDMTDRRLWLESIVRADGGAGTQRTDRSKTLAAQATLELADPQRLAFEAVRLTAPLADSLKLKKSLMESALASYNTAAGYGVAEVTTVATYRLGELYYQFSADLMDSERPGGLNEEELDQYEILLEEQAFPFEEQAITLFEVNASRAKSGFYDEWVALSYERLAALLPARYAKAEKAESYVSKLN
ncbi:MAG: tetratricopeptide repeat protein [Gammaproteobacteria bacterium]|nr:tetratricopeptide repeat protein [Gammaproteobacteria bacterium]